MNQVLNWRILWSSMPNFIRHEVLLSETKAQLSKHRATGAADRNFEVSYTFLGQAVCRNAFMMLTGVGAPFLQTARTGALADKESVAGRKEIGAWRSIRNTVWPQKYLDARQWLVTYAEKFGSWNPARDKCHLPAGRREFYHAAYVTDRVQQGCRPQQDGGGKRRKTEDTIVADVKTFLRAWSVELPWLLVNVSVGTFVHCPLCDYVKFLIERTSRAQQPMREMLLERLGDHFKFQGMQRLAQGELEEICNQSLGQKWFMKIDKMDNQKLACPTAWSQLATPLFKDPRRLLTGLVGSMWHGTSTIQHHVRTLFDDCGKGSQMQFSTIMLNLFDVFRREEKMPAELYVGADNTYKETKNQYTLWAFVWFLCLCQVMGLPLHKISLVFLTVGHTHDSLDRFFSRVYMSLRGRSWLTPDDMLALLKEHVHYTKICSGHVRQVWAWKALADKEFNPCYKEIHGLRHVHQIELSRTVRGIGIRWKQWMSDTVWSRFHILVPFEDIETLARFRPVSIPMRFQNEQPRMEWISQFEDAFKKMPTTVFENLDVKCNELRHLVLHVAQGTYAPGPTLEKLISELQDYIGPGRAPAQAAPPLPDATLAALFPGQNSTALNPDLLLKIRGITHDRANMALRSNHIIPGSNLVVRNTSEKAWTIYGFTIEFLVCTVMLTSEDKEDGRFLVRWYVPPLANQKYATGRKGAQHVDVFGNWKLMKEMSLEEQHGAQLPDPLVGPHDILDANFEMEDGLLPYDVFDTLRIRCNLDVTGLTGSQTPRGIAYRQYVESLGAEGASF